MDILELVTNMFSRWIKKVTGENLHPDPSDRERQEILGFVMKYVEYLDLNGDYFEFGVYKGDNLCRAIYYAGTAGLTDMHFHAFDSFEGLPEFSETDQGFNPFAPRAYAATEEEFLENLEEQGFDLSRLSIHTGWYEEVLPHIRQNQTIKGNAAIVWIDCDLYSSTRQALNFIKDYLVDGAIILFDDWFCFKGYADLGEMGAFREWLDRNPGIKAVPFRKFGWHGNSFIIQLTEK